MAGNEVDPEIGDADGFIKETESSGICEDSSQHRGLCWIPLQVVSGACLVSGSCLVSGPCLLCQAPVRRS